jgi:hypothetical protein
MNLRKCVVTILVIVICAFSTSIVAQTSGVNPTIGFVGDIPSELTWEELQAGYPIRVQNIGSSELEAIGFRIRVADTIKTQRYTGNCGTSTPPKVPCLISYEIFVAGLNGQTEIISLVCEYRKGEFKSYLPPCSTLYEVPRNQSNTFMLRARGKQPSKSFKLFVLVNESKGRFPISKQIMIKVPTTQSPSEMQTTKVFAQNKTITINVLCSLSNFFSSYCTERGNLIIQYDQIGKTQTRFALESSDGFNKNLFVDINPCEKEKKHLVISFPVSQEPTSIPAQERNSEAVKAFESYCNDGAIKEPQFPQDSLLGLQPGIYKANLDKIIGPDGKPLSLTVQIRHPFWFALFPALAGIVLTSYLKRRLGVIFPTQALLFKIHSTTKQYLEYTNSNTLTNYFDYEIEAALKIQANFLEERVRQVRASTTLVIDNGNEDYKKLVADVTAFSLVPNQWYDLVTSLTRLEGKKTSLEQVVKTQNPPDQTLVDLLKDIQMCYNGKAILSENTQAARQEASKHLVVAQRLAEITLEKLAERSPAWATARPKLEAWELIPANTIAKTMPTQKQKRFWLIELFSKIKIPNFLQSKTRKAQPQTSILGWRFNTTTWYDYVIPIIGLTITAYFEIYANYPSWGSFSDYVKSFGWGLVSNAITQVFFTAIERLPIGKLFGGQS